MTTGISAQRSTPRDRAIVRVIIPWLSGAFAAALKDFVSRRQAVVG